MNVMHMAVNSSACTMPTISTAALRMSVSTSWGWSALIMFDTLRAV